MFSKKYKIFESEEYKFWLGNETLKSQFQIDKRIFLIKDQGHFGDHRSVSDYIWKLRWKNGRRIYYAYITESEIILLLGGNKNGQSKDINKANKVLERNWQIKSDS